MVVGPGPTGTVKLVEDLTLELADIITCHHIRRVLNFVRRKNRKIVVSSLHAAALTECE
jgi:hypothetical protein